MLDDARRDADTLKASEREAGVEGSAGRARARRARDRGGQGRPQQGGLRAGRHPRRPHGREGDPPRGQDGRPPPVTRRVARRTEVREQGVMVARCVGPTSADMARLPKNCTTTFWKPDRSGPGSRSCMPRRSCPRHSSRGAVDEVGEELDGFVADVLDKDAAVEAFLASPAVGKKLKTAVARCGPAGPCVRTLTRALRRADAKRPARPHSWDQRRVSATTRRPRRPRAGQGDCSRGDFRCPT